MTYTDHTLNAEREARRAGAAVFLDELFRGLSGYVVIAYARKPFYNENGKYGHHDWRDGNYYAWPTQRDRLLDQALAADDADVYLVPALRETKSRKKHTAGPALWAWADIDREWTEELEALTSLPGFAVVASGRGSHVYARLPRPTETPEELDRWNRRLGAYLGDADSKWKDNSYLRLVGTYWRKPVPNGGEAVPVAFRVLPQEGVSDLDQLLPPDPADEKKKAASSSARSTGEAPRAEGRIRLDKLPRFITDLLAAPCEPYSEGGPDRSRSGRAFELVNVLYEYDYSDSEIIDILRDHGPSVDKYGHAGIPDQVAAIVAKQTRARGCKAEAHERKRSGDTSRQRPVEASQGSAGPDMGERRADGPGGGHNGPTAEVFDRHNPGGPDGWPLTDLGNAERLVDAHGDDLRYVHPWGSWLAWDGSRWAVDDTGAVDRRAKATVRAIYKRAAQLEEQDDRRALAKWAQKSESSGAARAMLTLATSEPGIPIRPEALDDKAWLLNVANGTLDLRTGELHRARREDYLTKQAPVAYDPDATCPRWLDFLDYTFAGDAELVEFVRRAVGYTLTGLTREQCLFLCHGPGRNGKSTFLKTVAGLLGEDYAQQAPTSLLLNRDKNSATNDIARLRGARLVTAVETPEGRRLDENLAKQLTGGDKITARLLHKEFFEFTPVLKLWIATNHRPEIRGTDLAIWRRIRLIPFGVIVPESDVDPDLEHKLQAELPGVLAWAVGGALAWQAGGLGMPSAIVAATQAYRDEMDQIGRFIDERCVTGPASSVKHAELVHAYRSWAADSGEHAVTAQKLRDQLIERSYEYVKRGTDSASRLGNLWRGIGLLELSERASARGWSDDD